MQFNDDSEELIYYLKELDSDQVMNLVHKRIKSGDDPLRIMQDCQKGVYQVGILYEQKSYYLSGLIMAGEILNKAMELILPAMENDCLEKSVGIAVIGTASGDIHDIGKDIIVMLLRCSGFKVYDLGVDVQPEKFLEKTVEVKPQIVGISTLLTLAHDSLQETIHLLKSETKAYDNTLPRIIIGGGQLDEYICKKVGADAWTTDALEGLRFCQQVIKGISTG